MNDQFEITSNISKRKFLFNMLKFENGYFISISEEISRIKSISVSLATSNQTNTAKVIQDRYDQLFIDTLSRRISLMINGICIISFFTKNKLQFEDMKTINDKILKAIEENKDEHQD
jgi:hypothetical protein